MELNNRDEGGRGILETGSTADFSFPSSSLGRFHRGEESLLMNQVFFLKSTVSVYLSICFPQGSTKDHRIVELEGTQRRTNNSCLAARTAWHLASLQSPAPGSWPPAKRISLLPSLSLQMDKEWTSFWLVSLFAFSQLSSQWRLF